MRRRLLPKLGCILKQVFPEGGLSLMGSESFQATVYQIAAYNVRLQPQLEGIFKRGEG